MDPDFKDLLPWQEMSKAVRELILRISNLEAAVYQLETDREGREEFQQKAEKSLVGIWRAINDLQSYHN